VVRNGTPESIALTISGRKTRSVLERDDIVNDADLKAAANRQADDLDKFTGTVSGTNADFSIKKRESAF
jgi:hypothetical protein